MTNNKFNKRAFISLVTFFLSIMVLITGVVLLVMPDATMAYWNKWSLVGLEKNQWEHFHAVISIYVTVIIVFHIIQNWKPMLSYMKSKAGQEFKNKRELVLAATLSFVLIIGSSVQSPISAITAVFEPAQEAWYSKKDEPPFEDAQGLPLNLLVKLVIFKEADIKNVFNTYEIKYDSLEESLEDIADKNDISSKRLYVLIKTKS